MPKVLLTLALAALLIPFACQKDTSAPQNTNTDIPVEDRNATIIPAGSFNQLANALQNSGTVILEAGIHTETNPVVISGYHQIIGRPGAVLQISSTPWTGVESSLSVALHFNNAGGSSISGVKIESSTPIGGAAVLIQNSQKVSVQRCEITGFQYGILVEKSTLSNLFQNKIAISTAWQTGAIPEAHGIVIVNGTGAMLEKNEISGAFFGIWACDKNGVCRKNKLHDNYIGLILCKVPANGLILPDGSFTGAQFSCEKWVVRNNDATNNLDAGYLVIDGANHNLVENNEAANNGTYDYELVGDSYRFGFLTPFSHDNTVKVGAGDTVKNCGQNNTVTGGIVIDTAVDPCN